MRNYPLKTQRPAARVARLAAALCPLLLLAGCPGDPLTIIPASLPDAIEGRSYREELETEGRDPQTWSIDDGSLPPGLTLDDDSGVISGTPTRPGDYDFTVAVFDSSTNRRSGARAYALTVIERLETPDTLASGRVGRAYNQRIEVDGGVPPYDVEVNFLPAGLEFDESSRRITGTPLNEDRDLEIEVRVRDSGSPRQVIAQVVSLPIAPMPVRITTAELDEATVGDSYSDRIRASDGASPYTFSITSGVLPDGLRLNRTTGVISGTPTEDGEFDLTIRVEDSDSPSSSDSATLTLIVNN